MNRIQNDQGDEKKFAMKDKLKNFGNVRPEKKKTKRRSFFLETDWRDFNRITETNLWLIDLSTYPAISRII